MSLNATRYGRRNRIKSYPQVCEVYDYETSNSCFDYLAMCWGRYPELERMVRESCKELRHDIYFTSDVRQIPTRNGIVDSVEVIESGAVPYLVTDHFRYQDIEFNNNYCLINGQWTKIGKYLARLDGQKYKHLLRAWELREHAKQFTWAISSIPDDVLYMSHDKSWTSCMRPNGLYEDGPVYSVLAGDLVFYLTERGADQPCGRVLIRKCKDGGYYPESRLYGYGPSNCLDIVENILSARNMLAREYNPVCCGGYSDYTRDRLH